MRLPAPLWLALAAAGCASPPDPPPPAPPPLQARTAPPRQAPPPSGPPVCIGSVMGGDPMSIEQIDLVLAAHGMSCGMAGSGGYAIAVPESQAAFAVEVLRAECPGRGHWGLLGGSDGGEPVEQAPPEESWPLLAGGGTFAEALERFPAGTAAGGLLRKPVVRAYARAFPRLLRLRGFARLHRDAALALHEGLEGTLELGAPEGRPQGSFVAHFQAWEDGARAEVFHWYTLPLVAVPEPDPGLAPWEAVAEAAAWDPGSREWILDTLDAAGLGPFPLPGRVAPDLNMLPDRYAVPEAEAARARELLRAGRPAWSTVTVLDPK